MASGYPTTLDSFATNHVDNVGEVIEAADVNDTADAVNKIEASFGTLTARNVYNVKAAPYSATGDGTTNDTTAIQAAIDAAEAAGGGIVYFPTATYICHGLTIEGSNITLMGAGWGSVLKQVAGASDNTHLITSLGTSTATTGNRTGLRFIGLQFLGRIDTDAATQFVHLLAISGVSDVLIDNCLFKAWRGDALYIGSGITTSVERHNERVRVQNCTFDGVTKTNRNGITVIDATGLWITRCGFMNCTATDRPGAIDIEPNNNAYHRVRDLHVERNYFENVGGNVGVIILDVTPTQATLTTDVQGVYFVGNTIRGATNSSAGIFVRQRQTPAVTDTAQNLVIDDNKIVDVAAGSVMYVEGVRGITVRRNYFGSSATGATFGYAFPVMDVTFEDNHLNLTGGAGATPEGTAIDIYSVTRMQIRRNIFDNIGLSDGTTRRLTSFVYNASVPSSSSDIEFSENTVIGGATTISGKAASHTLSLSTNKFRDNNVGSLVPDVTHWTGTKRSVHTFALKGAITVESTPSFFTSVVTGYQHVRIVKARHRITSGTNATFKIQKNGSDLTGYGTTGSPLTATTTAAETVSTQALVDNDELDLVLVGVSGSPVDLTVTIVLEHL